MRLLTLSLLRFGPFTDTVLDFAERPHALHVVFGPNEAGKSTSLRAIAGLLYGIDAATPDAHEHPMPELRIGGQLVARDGRSIEVVRRKGRSNTLLSPSGTPLDDDALAPFLGGVSAEGFRLTFGLDAARLREGAEALLAGEGAVGQILFDAATGGASVERALSDLGKAADELFRPRAKKARINAAVADFKRAKEAVRNRIHLPEAWESQRAALEEARKERAQLDERRKELAREKQKLQRAKQALPQLSRWRTATAQLEAMGPVPQLDPSIREERQDVEQKLREASQAIVPEERRLASLRQERDALALPEALLSVDASLIRELSERLGSQRKARRDLPRVRARMEELLAEAERIAARLAPDGVAAAERFRLTTAQTTRIQELATRKPPEASELGADLERRERQRDAVASRLEGLAVARDTARLERALSRGRRAGELPDRIAALGSELKSLERTAARRLAAHAPYAGDLAGVLSLVLPSRETVDRLAEEHAAIAREEQRIRGEQLERESRLRAVDQELDALVREAEVPTVEDLEQARLRRDSGWRLVRRRLDGEAIDEDAGSFDAQRELPEAFEHAMATADGLADRLRREAGAVARRAQLEAERERHRGELVQLSAAGEECEQRAARFDEEWRALWRPAALEPLSPLEMRGFLERHAGLVELSEKHAAEKERLTRLTAELEELCKELRGALEELGDSGQGGLPELLDEAEARVAREAERRSEQRETAQELQRVVAELDAERERAARQDAARQAWRAAWSEAVAPLGFSGDALPAEVLAVLDEAKELFARLEQASSERARIAGMERDSRAFAQDVQRLVESARPDLLEREPETAVERLSEAHQEALRMRRERERLERECTQRERELAELKARQQVLSGRLAELVRGAGVGTLEELRALEERVDDWRKLEQERSSIERNLSEALDGLTVQELLGELAGVELEEAKLRLRDIEGELEHLEDDREAVLSRIATLEEALRRFESTEGEEAALDLEAVAAKVHGDVERYTRLRLAVAVLSREVERYRQENQGPVLERAGALFRRLTHDRYLGLVAEVGSGDRVVLHATRADQKAVELAGLSDGARDQLYLALRLASLERHARAAEPLPLVLDDVLASFDEERTSAALSVLAEVAQTTQVLLFTHHAHLVKLAREAVAADRLMVHALARVGPGAELRAFA